jgi:hypothetical protein
MQKYMVLTGDITFTENPHIAVVNSIDNVCLVDNADTASDLGESLLNSNLAYLIPQLYNGKIIWKDGVIVPTCSTCVNWSRRNKDEGLCEGIDLWSQTSDKRTSAHINLFADDDSNLHMNLITGCDFSCSNYKPS